MGSETLSEALMSERRRSSVALLLITKQNYERCSCAAKWTLNFVRLRHVRARRLLGPGYVFCTCKTTGPSSWRGFIYSRRQVWRALWTCGASARHIPAQGGGLGSGGDEQNLKSMWPHRSSAHSFVLLLAKEPRCYGASPTSGLPIMSPSASTIRLSADCHQCQ